MIFLITTGKRFKLISMEDSRYIFIILDVKRISATQPKNPLFFQDLLNKFYWYT